MWLDGEGGESEVEGGGVHVVVGLAGGSLERDGGGRWPGPRVSSVECRLKFELDTASRSVQRLEQLGQVDA